MPVMRVLALLRARFTKAGLTWRRPATPYMATMAEATSLRPPIEKLEIPGTASTAGPRADDCDIRKADCMN
jgi:hypothetical protein